jgi:hypothetical protein
MYSSSTWPTAGGAPRTRFLRWTRLWHGLVDGKAVVVEHTGVVRLGGNDPRITFSFRTPAPEIRHSGSARGPH